MADAVESLPDRAAPPRVRVFLFLAFVVLAGLGLYSMRSLALEAFDAGVFSNVLWKVAHGAGDVSGLTGSHHFGDHPSLTLLLLVPFYVIGVTPGVAAFVVAEAASVALVGLAVWRIGGLWSVSPRCRWALMLASVAGPGALYAATADLHAFSLALGPLAMTISGAASGSRSRWFYVWPLLAAGARSEMAVVVLIAGVLLVRERSDRPARVTLIIGGAASILFVGWVILTPLEGSSAQVHFAHLGDTPVEVLGGALRHPLTALEPLLSPQPWVSLIAWLGFFGLMAPLAGARWLLPAIPSVLIPFLGSWPSADRWITQYWYVLLPLAAIAAAAGLRDRPALARTLPVIVVAIVGVVWLAGVATAFGGLYSSDYGADAEVRELVDHYRDDPRSMSVPSQLVVPLSGRDQIMVMPRPFLCAEDAYGSFRPPGLPVELVVIDERWPLEQVAGIREALEAAYEVERTTQYLTVWRLVRPGEADLALETCSDA